MEVIFNKSKYENHLKTIRRLISASDEIIFCSGWVKIEGLKLLSKELASASDRNAKITVITNKEHTDENCADFFKSYRLKHIIVDDKQRYFHTKMYYFKSSDTYHAIIGSANLTSGALTNNEELSVLISGQIGDDQHTRLSPYLKRLSTEYEVE